ncbi:MAG TPA: hypothetical protein VMD59_20600 [Acidimicrobiales bacterium]|nr:hypothetical protein [Acidimicrobiales bacterium]
MSQHFAEPSATGVSSTARQDGTAEPAATAGTAEPAGSTLAATTAFACPRCGRPAEERFYGPCGRCRSELVATMAGEARDIDRPDFEPRANVVANHIATKD